MQRQKLADFLDTASEDDFTEKVLVPLFQRLGFHRVSPSGHTEKTLEFGKDLWMKYQLPTSHWIYFCAQIKKDKIDASGTGGNNNVATVLTQALMAIDHPIFDPRPIARFCWITYYLISAGRITRAARTWLVERLDTGQRRHIIFMDRDEFLDQSARILLDFALIVRTSLQMKTFRFDCVRQSPQPVRRVPGAPLLALFEKWPWTSAFLRVNIRPQNRAHACEMAFALSTRTRRYQRADARRSCRSA